MKNIAKQKRSKKRVEIILQTAKTIIENKGVDNLTIAEIAKESGLKRTSTYKFIPTVESLKELVIIDCINDCIDYVKSQNIKFFKDDDLTLVINKIVTSIYSFFESSEISQKLILKYTLSPPINSSCIHDLGSLIEGEIEKKISLNDVFNKSGVCRVIAQIILAIFSLNAKESGKLNEVGKIEASRAVVAYIKSWLGK